ncbi:MAG TPA: helix-turn-helix transcriptional regulator [Candidatus Saccharimonadales bacterium]|nr:helix-turn-helix transcriptional regulator [Candidatus Saccharimonadales bacterium]
MSDKEQNLPFKPLGDRLKTLRQKLHESVSEVSGAVEIDEQMLARIEQGQDRPSEDILMLLISHFGMQEDEAAGLWQLAGYDQPHTDHDHSNTDADPQNGRTMVMIMAVDPRIIYTDSAQVTANPQGVVINFSQGTGTSHFMTTARIGMSREQAENLIHILSQTLEQSKPRSLPPGKQSKRNGRRQSDEQE